RPDAPGGAPARPLDRPDQGPPDRAGRRRHARAGRPGDRRADRQAHARRGDTGPSWLGAVIQDAAELAATQPATRNPQDVPPNRKFWLIVVGATPRPLTPF